MCKLLHLREIVHQTRKLLKEIEAIVGLRFSFEDLLQEKARIADENADLWIPLLEHVKVADLQASIAERNEELARIRQEIFGTRPKQELCTDLRFLAWCHSAMELIIDLGGRSIVGGIYGTALVEVYLGSILQYFQACLLGELKRARAHSEIC